MSGEHAFLDVASQSRQQPAQSATARAQHTIACKGAALYNASVACTFTLVGILHSQLLAIPRPALAGWWPLPGGCAGGRWHPGSGCTCPACVLVVARIRAAQLAHRRAHAPLHPQQVCCWMLACALTSGLANNSCSCCGMLFAGLWQTRFFNWRPLRLSAPPPQSPNPPSQLHSRGSCC
jgi:hypothetical protein